MNKIFKNILSVAVVSASLVSCSQVDTISDVELEEQKQSTTITLNLHSGWQGTPIVFATNTMGFYNRAFIYNLNGENKLNVPVGKYKFYVINRDEADFDYEKVNLAKLPMDDLYYGDVRVAHKIDELNNITDQGVKNALSGDYVKLRGGVLRGDSTMLVDVKLGQNVSATTQKPYTLTTDYLVSGSVTSNDNYIDRIYVEICDIVAKKRPNGSAVGGKKLKALLTYSGVKKGGKKDLKNSLVVLGVPKSGTANIYVRFLNADKSTAPEKRTVNYTVVDGQDDNGANRRIIKLGDITF